MQSTMMGRISALLTREQPGGFHCCPTSMTESEAALSRRNQKIARFYEQGASKGRVGVYLRRWLGWAGTLVTCAALVVIVAGCGYRMATGNESISNKENTAQIKIGDWTKIDVRKILGEPTTIVIMVGGEEIWNYVYVSGKIVVGYDNARDMKTFSIRFTREGIVKEKGYWRILQ